ncbi:GntR family transcriptional regulator [Arsukibacterium indicum]|uniref:GntR family transcriptional regulator n=1 Tax=Arsukibacterium indicum TaxID=2848612 RepID=A0ABS6MN94_9GAMM|nr:GntR family transcriptional regulator [Arsukibacterium indicum]MBV2130287.1 GntR family transcriptional regulator [Arsukibacterium indicum]
MFSINPNSGEPIYRQLTGQIKRMVAGGQLKAGDELPSVRELASQYAVNPMTISKAYSLLETEGVLERQRGKPMTIASQLAPGQSEAARLQQLSSQLEQLTLAAKQLQLPKQSVLLALSDVFDRMSDVSTKP